MAGASTRKNLHSRTLPGLLGAVSLAIALGWGVLRVVAEPLAWWSWPPLQVLAWVPVQHATLAALATVAMGWVLKKKRRPPGWALPSGTLAALLLVVGTMIAWNLHRAVPAQRGEGVRLAYLNAAGDAIERWPALEGPVDVLVVVNRRGGQDMSGAWSWVEGGEAGGDAALLGGCVLMSRLPIRRHGRTSVDFSDVWPEENAARPSGWAAWVEFEGEDGPFVLWVVDLPSPLSISRADSVGRTLGAIRAWRGPAWVVQPSGLRRLESGASFPVPDAVVGDFNTPRWSRALAPFREQLSLREVSGAAGVGASGTFGGPLASWPIDLCFVSDGDGDEPVGLSHTTFRVPGLAHRAVVVSLGRDAKARPQR